MNLESISLGQPLLSSSSSTSEPPLSGWKKTAYDVALLAPKLFFSGAGWVIGLAIGGILGAGFGDAIGTGIGCAISYAIEWSLKKWVFHIDTQGLFMKRAKDAAILCAGSLIGGLLFNPAYKWTSSLSKLKDLNITRSLATGFISASGFMAGSSLARGGYTLAKDKERGLSKRNFIKDLSTASLIIWPAEAAFVSTALPVLTSKFLVAKAGESTVKQALKGGASVLIGGTAGAILKDRVEHYLPAAA